MEVLNYQPLSMDRLVKELQSNFARKKKAKQGEKYDVVEPEIKEDTEHYVRKFSERFEDLAES